MQILWNSGLSGIIENNRFLPEEGEAFTQDELEYIALFLKELKCKG